jgi:hypothetical protein
MLFHDDLSMNNILVDSHGHLTAVLDWECAWQFPQLLCERIRDEKPNKSTYADDSTEGNASEDPEIDNEGVCNSYWE